MSKTDELIDTLAELRVFNGSDTNDPFHEFDVENCKDDIRVVLKACKGAGLIFRFMVDFEAKYEDGTSEWMKFPHYEEIEL